VTQVWLKLIFIPIMTYATATVIFCVIEIGISVHFFIENQLRWKKAKLN